MARANVVRVAVSIRAGGDPVRLKLRSVVGLHDRSQLRQLVHLRSSPCHALRGCQGRIRSSERGSSCSVGLVSLAQPHDRSECDRDPAEVQDDSVLNVDTIRCSGRSEACCNNAYANPRVSRCDNTQRCKPRRRILRSCTCSCSCLGADGYDVGRSLHTSSTLVVVEHASRLPRPSHAPLAWQQFDGAANLPVQAEQLGHELCARTTVRDKLHRVAGLRLLAIVRLAVLVLVAEHLLPALIDELGVAIVDRADVALKDKSIAARCTPAPLEEIALLCAVILAARPQVGFERLLAGDSLLGKLALPARQQRSHQRLLRRRHVGIALDAQLGHH
eukprot:7391590-Prymnesium_polylepis.2